MSTIIAEILDGSGNVVRSTNLGAGYKNLWSFRPTGIDGSGESHARVQLFGDGRAELIVTRRDHRHSFIASTSRIPDSGLNTSVLSPAGTRFHLRFRPVFG